MFVTYIRNICSQEENTHRQVSVPQYHLFSLYDGLQDPVVERLRQVEILHCHVYREEVYLCS